MPRATSAVARRNSRFRAALLGTGGCSGGGVFLSRQNHMARFGRPRTATRDTALMASNQIGECEAPARLRLERSIGAPG
jgi:hypothetical protein